MTAPKGAAVKGPRSAARVAFHDNSSDVRSLFALFQAAKGSAAIRRHLAPATKGTYLLVAALWETYCEDVLLETTAHLVREVTAPDRLPTPLRRAIARDLKSEAHELSPWRLAGDGWKEVTRTRAVEMCRQTIFNSPKARNVDLLFSKTLGLADITGRWTTPRAADPVAALDAHIILRGELAHRAAATEITRQDVSDFYQLVSDLAAATDQLLGEYLLESTGTDPYLAAAPTTSTAV